MKSTARTTRKPSLSQTLVEVFRRLLPRLAVCAAGIALASLLSPALPPSRTQSPTQPLRAREVREPLGADRCAFCHPAEVNGYARTAMARSLRRARSEPGGTVDAHGSKITMRSTAGGSWQDWENKGDRAEYRVDYVIGSGTHARGYIVDIDGHLFQSPVAFYTSRNFYDLAPGYEKTPDPDFTRPVSEECVLCHSGTALHVAGTVSEYRAPVFPAEGITCERCHGPVERHLADPRAGTIVNPAKLAPAARDSVCEQCHLFGVSRVPNPGKKLGDFVAGQRSEDVFTTYRDLLPPERTAANFKVISHVEQLALSACARKSEGRLWCGTCHDPHEEPAEPARYYRARCLSCHSGAFPASHPLPESDCLACHMPRRFASDGGHSAFTDHRIQRRPLVEQDAPPGTRIAAWREPAQGLEKRNLGIALVDVGIQRRSSPFVIEGYRYLTEVQRQFADDSDLFKWIGEALLLARKPVEAQFAFDRALALDPHSALNEAGAAAPSLEAADPGPAIAHLERSVELDPLNLPAVSTLIELYRRNGRTGEAEALSAKLKASFDRSSTANGATAPGPAAASKTAEQAFKNIQVLNGISADRLLSGMQFMSYSLGVGCGYCHVEGAFERDQKKTKQTAREMIRMMAAINRDNFDGRREVTCFSCHQGAARPEPVPDAGAAGVPVRNAGEGRVENQAATLPTVAQLLGNYVNALGGAAAIGKLASRVQTGHGTVAGGSAAIEIYTQSPGKRTVLRHGPGGESRSTVDGDQGWIKDRGPLRHMHDAELELAQIEADLQFPLHLERMFPELGVEYPETIDGRGVNVLAAARQNGPRAKFYFDQESGLLVRVAVSVDSPLGIVPAEVDYADYRDVDGVKAPFRVTLVDPETTSVLQFTTIRQNAEIDPAQFTRPRM